MKYVYNNKGTCSVRTEVELNPDHTIASVQVLGGCNGNLKAVSKLVKGHGVDEIVSILAGNTCGPRKTSCADQLSRALTEAAAAAQQA